VLLSFVNTSPGEAVKLSLKLAGPAARSVAGTILTAPSLPGARSVAPAPAAPAAGQPVPFHGAVARGKVLEITVPARSVVVLTVRQDEPTPLRAVQTTRTRSM
jgi:hypothetical protein